MPDVQEVAEGEPRPHIVIEYKGEVNQDEVDTNCKEFDALLEVYEKHVASVVHSTSSIRKMKAENECLMVMESLRDYMQMTVAGGKRELALVFGGECIRIGRVFHYIETLQPKCSERVIEDARWTGLQDAANMVKQVLESMGKYRRWRPPPEPVKDEEPLPETSETEAELEEEEAPVEPLDEDAHQRWVASLLAIVPTVDFPDFTNINDVQTLEELLAIKVNEKYQYKDWMTWMVHRVHLNDPTLTELSFANMVMPLPHNDANVAPKLVNAIGTNTYLEQLELQNSTLQTAEAEVLAMSLEKNHTLRDLNIEGNVVDTVGLCALAAALARNKGLQVVRVAGQQTECSANRGLGQRFEEILGYAMLKNNSVQKIGVELYNANWRDVVNRKLTQNIDRHTRMQRKTARANAYEDTVALTGA